MSYRVIDNFSPYADAARASALAAGFGTWRPNKGEVGSSVYEGMCFWGQHAMLLDPLMRNLGPVIPNSMFFRVTNADTEAAYVHSDREAGDYTCVVYLSDHPSECGTGFYRHRRTGLIQMPPMAEVSTDSNLAGLKEEMVKGSEEDWERVDFVTARFNRALIFEAPLFHARLPRHGFSDTAESGRMVWVCHFMIPRASHG